MRKDAKSELEKDMKWGYDREGVVALVASRDKPDKVSAPGHLPYPGKALRLRLLAELRYLTDPEFALCDRRWRFFLSAVFWAEHAAYILFL